MLSPDLQNRIHTAQQPWMPDADEEWAEGQDLVRAAHHIGPAVVLTVEDSPTLHKILTPEEHVALQALSHDLLARH